jgi:hypothetical protein
MTDTVLQQVAHTLRVGDRFVRIYRYAKAGTAVYPGGTETSHLVVFAKEVEELDRRPPSEHGLDPLELIDLIDAASVASVLIDLYEGRSTLFEAAAVLRAYSVEEIEEAEER